MAKRPVISAEERERNRRLANELQRTRCNEVEKAATATAQAWLEAQGALVPGEGVRERLGRLDAYRRALVQTSVPAYRPTRLQQMAAPCHGISVEIEF